MIWHPLVLAIVLLDFLSTFLIVLSLNVLFPTLLHWEPGQSSKRQLKLEPRLESALLQNLFGGGIYAFSAILMFAGIALVFPSAIPGAMCGTGVMESLGPSGMRMVILRVLGLTLYFVFYKLHRISMRSPRGEHQQTMVRCLLIILPVIALGFWETAAGFSGMNTSQPVDCCAAVLDLVHGQSAVHLAALPQWLTQWASLPLALILVTMIFLRRDKGIILVVLTLVWSVSAYALLLNHLLPYHYGVLEHHCPWCSLKPEYYFAGFALFPLLLWLNWEALGQFIEHRLHPGNSRVNWMIPSGMILFYGIAGGPAVWWYISSGTLIH